MSEELSIIIFRTLQGIQSEEELSTFLAWYRASPENKTFYFELKHRYDQREGGLKPSQSEVLASWERLQAKLQGRNTGIRRRLHVWKAAGIAVALLLTVGLGVYLVNGGEPTMEWVEITTEPKSKPKTIRLPDGSMVQLNASSVFRYPASFGKKRREVHLDGEAYFTVARDSQRPFIVYTDKQRVNVVGTEFNLLAYATDPYAITTLVRGAVNLELVDERDNHREVVSLNPGQQVFFNKSSKEAALSVVDPLDITSWLNGVYRFRDIPLEQITLRLEKIHGVNFVIAEEALRNEKYTGKFFLDQTLEEVVHVLNFKGNYRIEYRDNNLYIKSK